VHPFYTEKSHPKIPILEKKGKTEQKRMAEEQSVQIPRVKLGSQGLEVKHLSISCFSLQC
jgi:hypothetical protein